MRNSLAASSAAEIRAHMGREAIRSNELARRLGVSDTWVTRRLNGQVRVTLEDLGRICAALGIEAADIIRPSRQDVPA